MAKNRLTEEEILHSHYLISCPRNVRKRILVLDIIVAILGVLGCCCLAVPPLVTGIRANDNSQTMFGAVLMGLTVVWIILFIPVCLNKEKKVVGGLFGLWILLLIGGLLGYRVYQYITPDSGIGLGNIIVLGILTASALIGLILYLVQGKTIKIGARYCSFVLLLVPAVFSVIHIYTYYALPYYNAWRALSSTATSLEWYFGLISFIGSVLLSLNVVLTIGSLAGRLVDRGNNLVVIEKEIVEKEVTVEVIKEVPAKPRANGLVIIKSKKKDSEPEKK